MDLVDVRSWRRPADRAGLALEPGEVVVAGGTWLFSEPQPGTTGLVDLTALGWPAWEPTADGLRVSATCTIAGLGRGPDAGLAGLARACADALLMSWKVQAAATVGGNLCLALPAGAMTALGAVLDGEAVVWTPDGGERREPVATFVRGVRSTSLAPGEVLRAVDLPARALGRRTAVRQASLAAYGRSAALVVGRADPEALVVVVTAATTRPVVLRLPADPTTDQVGAAVAEVDCWYDDPHGPADWRAHVTGLLVAEVCAELTA